MTKHGQGRTKEQHREHMRIYMRRYRLGAGINRSVDVRPDITKAAYDPKRDGLREHSDLTAMLMGDPPIGQRALDWRQNK